MNAFLIVVAALIVLACCIALARGIVHALADPLFDPYDDDDITDYPEDDPA